MADIELVRNGNVFELRLLNGDAGNVFGENTFAEYFAVIEELAANTENAALVITSDHEKHWCNGINLEHLKKHGIAGLHESGFFIDMENMYLRLATLNMPVVAAISGNCYAGGAILASAADFRYMRSDRGRFCFSEIDVKIAIAAKMMEVIKLLPSTQAVNRLVLTGEAITGEQALELQVADRIFPQTNLREKAMEYAEFLSQKDRDTYGKIKLELRKQLLPLL